MSPLPDEAVVSGTLNEYWRPLLLAEAIWAYVEEAVTLLEFEFLHLKRVNAYPDPRGPPQQMLFSLRALM
jgi:hypothetical protein